MGNREPKADRRTVVKHIEGVALEAKSVHESFDGRGKGGERVFVFPLRRHRSESETRQIRSDHAIASS
jgi:hypothetical protein